jgi:photosystem II stability/assembly factor-like uncharacterized protein
MTRNDETRRAEEMTMSEILVATRKGLFTLERASQGNWRVRQTSFLGDRVSMTLVDGRDHTWYAGLDHGHFGCKLHRSEDRGATWTEITMPAFPVRPEGVSETMADGKELPWSVKLIWSLAAGGADEPGTLWCGTIPGGLFRSADRGSSWQLVEGLWNHPGRKEWFGGGYDHPGIHSIVVDPRDARRVLIAVSSGGVWQTRDGGQTWSICAKGMFAEYMPPQRRDDERIQDVHCMVQCTAAPERLWAQHHNAVFRSIDDAASWQAVQVPPSVFGFATAVHPRDPDTAWFVPAIKDERRIPVGGAMVVARTRDGGASFELLREGLPQEHAYDLVYRHGLAVDETGDVLAMGSTTGNLWVSEDQGDRWTCVSHHLPPIASIELA